MFLWRIKISLKSIIIIVIVIVITIVTNLQFRRQSTTLFGRLTCVSAHVMSHATWPLLMTAAVSVARAVWISLQNSITASENAKHDGAHRVYGGSNVKHKRPFVLSLVAHDVAGENGADDAGHGAYDIFETEHMAGDERRDVEVVACAESLKCVVMFLMPEQAKLLTHTHFRTPP
jgi:hypothetical protein